jgi:hypothetical protein
MQGWFGRSLLIGGVFSMVWMAVVYSWRVNNRLPNGTEVALYFVALPIALLFVIWLAVKAWRFANSPATPKSSIDASGSNSATTSKADATEHVAVNERGLSIGVLSCAIRTAHGSSAEELAANLIANEARLDLDPELLNRDGFPVLTGRIADIDKGVQLDTLNAWGKLTGREYVDWSDEQLRAISIGAEVAVELGQQAIKHPLLEPYIAAIEKNRELPPLPMLQLMTVLPESWSLDQRQFVVDWIFDLIQQQGWPIEKLNSRAVLQSSPTSAMVVLDQLMLDSFRLSQVCFGMLIACDSNIGDATVQKWEDAGTLFVGKNGNAQMPGEGAAGVLVADEMQVQLMALETNVRLSRIVQNRRNKSIDVRGNPGESILEQMTQDALTISEISANKIAFISSDTDQRSNRIVELMSVGLKLFPDLDPTTQYARLTNNCGEMGAVASLAALVLGHFQALSGAEPVLCISNMDPYERTVALLSPWVGATNQSVTTP